MTGWTSMTWRLRMIDPIMWLKRHIEMLSVKWPARSQALKLASRISQLNDKRIKFERQCNHCKKWFKTKDVQVDHIEPKGKYSRETFMTWIDRLFCPVENYQVLCKPCHVKKSAKEHKDGSYK